MKANEKREGSSRFGWVSQRAVGISACVWVSALPMLMAGIFLSTNGFTIGKAVIAVAALVGIGFPMGLLVVLAKSGVDHFRQTGDRSALVIAAFVVGGLAWAIYGAFVSNP